MEKMPYKTYLEENEIPAAWYNLRADMKNKPAPSTNQGRRAVHLIKIEDLPGNINPRICDV